ncbi:MAG: flavin reductase [Elusimicrobiota bacterium]|jgi:flavin reductase (DIM6/NTAB) family NADH-FMN oxidoreductase RutF|nr:flavin reductase [Elusimicrobiota bacterium]
MIDIDKEKFCELFKEIKPEEIPDDVFTLVGKVFPVITAGKGGEFNSMTASGGGMGLLFRKHSVWLVIQQGRLTLELMKKEQSWSLSYFPDEYKKQVFFLGSKSGRDSDKMKEVELTAIPTPAGNIAFKEARLIIDCKLTQVTSIYADDFCTKESKAYIDEVYKDPNELRQYVFGEIVSVWVKK